MNVGIKILVGSIIFGTIIMLGLLPLAELDQNNIVYDKDSDKVYNSFSKNITLVSEKLNDIAGNPSQLDTEDNEDDSWFTRGLNIIKGVISLPSLIFDIMNNAYDILADNFGLPSFVKYVVFGLIGVIFMIALILLMREMR